VPRLTAYGLLLNDRHRLQKVVPAIKLQSPAIAGSGTYKKTQIAIAICVFSHG
jgi:hypothetical protein